MLDFSAFAPYSIARVGSSKGTLVNLTGPIVKAMFDSTDATGYIYAEIFVPASCSFPDV